LIFRIKSWFNPNSLLSHLALYTVTDLISRAFPFLVFPIVIKYLNPEDFGIVTNFNVLIQVVGAFIGLHLGTYITSKYYKKDVVGHKEIFSSALLIYITIFLIFLLVMVLGGDLIARVFGLKIEYIYMAVVTVLFTSISSLVSVFFRLSESPFKFSLFTLSSTVLASFLTFNFLHYFHLGVLGRVLSTVIPALLFGLLGLVILIKNNLITISVSKRELKEQLKFGLPMLPHTLSFWVKTGFDRLIITNQIGLAANGIFSIGATFGSIFFIFNNSFINAYVPNLYKRLSGDDVSSSLKLKIVKELYLYILGFALILFVGYFAIEFTVLEFFKEYKDSIAYLPYFLIFNLFNVLYQVSVNFIFFVQKSKYLGVITFSISVFQGLLGMLLIKHYALHGVGLAMVLTSFLLFIIVFGISNKVYKMPWLLKI